MSAKDLAVVNKAGGDRIVDLMRRRTLTVAQVSQVAGYLDGRLPHENSTQATLLQFAWLASDVLLLRKHNFGAVSGPTPPVLATTRLLQAMAHRYAARLPLDGDVESEYRRLLESVGHKRGDEGLWHFELLLQAWQNRRSMGIHLAHTFGPATEPALDRLLTEPAIASALKDRTALAQQLDGQRKYGVKPTSATDGLIHRPQEAWVTLDGFGWQGGVQREGLTGNHILAQVFLSDPDANDLSVTTVGDEKNHRLTGFPADCYFSVRPDGSLSLDEDFGVAPLSELFDQLGIGDAYPVYHLVHLLRVYDLVVPVEKIRDLPSLARIVRSAPAQGMAPDATATRHQLWERLPFITMPRLRLMDNPEALRIASEQELARAEAVTAAREAEIARQDSVAPPPPSAHEPRRQHRVEGFVRPLPPGQHASPTAIAKAWEEKRIVLKPGETYVKIHDRGSGPAMPVGHRTRRRNAATARDPRTQR